MFDILLATGIVTGLTAIPLFATIIMALEFVGGVTGHRSHRF